MSVRVVSQPRWETDERFVYPITCGSPTEIEPVDYKDWQIQFIVSLDEDSFAMYGPEDMSMLGSWMNPYRGEYRETLGVNRIVRHIPNPYRGEGKPIDMTVVDMAEVEKTALMIVLLSEIGGVFFHCRKGKDRTGLVKAEVEHILIQRMEVSA